MSFYFGFGFYCGEELGGHHPGCTLDHSLSNAGDGSAYLNITVVADDSASVLFGKVQVSGSLQESRLPLAIDDQSVVLGFANIFQSNVAGEDAFDRTHAGLECRRVTVRAGQLKSFATRNASLQDRRIDERTKYAISLGVDLLSALYLHLIEPNLRG